MTASGVINAGSGFQQNGVNLNTSHIPDSTNKRYVTDAEKAAIGSASGALLTANNLSDVPNKTTARTNLGLGTLATQNGSVSGTNTGDETAASIAAKLVLPSSKLGGIVLFDHLFAAGNYQSATLIDLFSYTAPANTLSVNGQKLSALYGGTFANNTKNLLVYFGGNLVFDLEEQGGSNEDWQIEITIFRNGSTTGHAITKFTSKTHTNVKYFALSGLNFNIGNILKIAASGNDAYNVIAYAGTIGWHSAA